MSFDTTYAAKLSPFTLSHWRSNPQVAGDYDYISVNVDELDARIKSGDYFVTLATTLEVISKRRMNQQAEFTEDLERIANELLYLQNYYAVVRKSDEKHDVAL